MAELLFQEEEQQPTVIVTMLDRIKMIMDKEQMAPSKFAEAIGIQRSAMSHILSERNKPSLEVVMKILERFNYVDPGWMLSGKGDMLLTDVPYRKPDSIKNTLVKQAINANVPENPKEMEVNSPQISHQQSVKESIIYKEIPPRKISWIMVFYSDDTFDIFVSEKNKKD